MSSLQMFRYCYSLVDNFSLVYTFYCWWQTCEQKSLEDKCAKQMMEIKSLKSLVMVFMLMLVSVLFFSSYKA